MKRARLFLSSAALLFGLLVVFISLVSTNQVISFENSQASSLKFYLGEKILPDHVVYPLVAAADRAILLAAPKQEKIKLKLVYSRIRMEYAQGLLIKNEPALANNALTKSQKYVSLAALAFLDADLDNPELKTEIKKQLELNIEQAQVIIDHLSPCQASFANQLNKNNQALLTKFD